MKLSTLGFIAQATTVLGSIFDTILPTVSPTITEDPWPCTTEVLERYFDPPKPTGELLTALFEHGQKLLKGCTPIGRDAQGVRTCEFPAQSKWCAITIPTALSSTWSAYGSTASSWWSRYRSEAVDFATYCPSEWYRAMNAMPAGGVWLNDTIAFAGCYEQDHGAPATAMATTTVATPDPTGTTTPKPTQPAYVDECGQWYLVQEGDSCEKIAQDHHLSLGDVLRWNPGVGGDCAGLTVDTYACVGVEIAFNFDNADLKEWDYYDGSFSFRSRALYADNSAGGKALFAKPFVDLILEAQIAIPDDADGNSGLVFRASNPAVGPDSYQGYYAGIDSDGFVILGRADNNWIHLGDHQIDIRPGQVYHLGIKAIGPSIEVYVDDMENPKISVSDDTYSEGLIGVRVYETAANYYNIRVAS